MFHCLFIALKHTLTYLSMLMKCSVLICIQSLTKTLRLTNAQDVFPAHWCPCNVNLGAKLIARNWLGWCLVLNEGGFGLLCTKDMLVSAETFALTAAGFWGGGEAIRGMQMGLFHRTSWRPPPAASLAVL